MKLIALIAELEAILDQLSIELPQTERVLRVQRAKEILSELFPN